MTQWYSIDPEHGVEIWATEAEAKAAAEAALEHYRDNASDGWHEQMEALEWGMLITHGHAKEVDRVEREDDDTGLCERIGADYRCDYVLQDCAQESLAEVLSERSEKRELEALACTHCKTFDCPRFVMMEERRKNPPKGMGAGLWMHGEPFREATAECWRRRAEKGDKRED